MAELKTLRLEQSGFRHAIKKGFRVIKHKGPLEEKQALLEKYQQVLDTRILIRLDSRSLQESQDFQTLDRDVRNVVIAMEKGHRTFAQLLADQGQDLKDHIDKGFEKQAQTTADSKAHQQLLESLFFPEIVSRQEQISEAYQGTYQWIFDPPTSERVRNMRWSNFHDWLETGHGIYWISGKPGAGKSTLMKFIVHENQTSQLLDKWKQDGELLIISFFFWRPGSALQKSATGLLRSLLYQIARQWPDLINHIGVQDNIVTGDISIPTNIRHLAAWTDQRLLYALECFLSRKPTSLRICALIDGLDEFIGEEELLLNVVRIFGDAPQCKVCVASRPEQAFRQEFRLCSQLRVHDLNHEDIVKTVAGKLLPYLTKYRESKRYKYPSLEDMIVEKAEGVFLWLNLMIKILVRGARNEDSYETLLSRLEKTPDTVKGMYTQIWESLDYLYKEERLKYFHTLLAAKNLNETMSLADLVCAEAEPRKRVIQFDRDYFLSEQFDSACRHAETRLVACCGVFLETRDCSEKEIKEQESDDEMTKMQELKIEEMRDQDSRKEDLGKAAVLPFYNKWVDFVHRTAFDFVEDQYNGLHFYESSSYQNAGISLAAGKIGRLVLLSLTHTRDQLYWSHDLVGSFNSLMKLSCTMEHFHTDVTNKPSERSESLQNDLTHQVFQSLEQLHTFFHETEQNPIVNVSFIRRLDDLRTRDFSHISWCPILDRLSVAAYFACHKYVQSQLPKLTNVDEHIPILFQCVLLSFEEFCSKFLDNDHRDHISRLLIIRTLLDHRLNPNTLLTPNPYITSNMFRGTYWGMAFMMIMLDHSTASLNNKQVLDLTWRSCTADVVEKFLYLGASPNTRIPIPLLWFGGTKGFGTIWLQMSPLALINLSLMYFTESKLIHMLTEIQKSLRSAGAVKHMNALCIMGIQRPNNTSTAYRLSKVQADKLNEAITSATVFVSPYTSATVLTSSYVWHDYSLRSPDESTRVVLKEIRNSFSEEDAISIQTILHELETLPESF